MIWAAEFDIAVFLDLYWVSRWGKVAIEYFKHMDLKWYASIIIIIIIFLRYICRLSKSGLSSFHSFSDIFKTKWQM